MACMECTSAIGSVAVIKDDLDKLTGNAGIKDLQETTYLTFEFFRANDSYTGFNVK